MLVQDEDEKRSADYAGQNTELKFGGRDRSAKDIDNEHENPAEDYGNREHLFVVRTNDHTRGVRNHKANPSDRAGQADAARRDQRGTQDEHSSGLTKIDSERFCFAVAQRKHIKAIPHEQDHGHRKHDHRKDREYAVKSDHCKRTHHPVGDLCQLRVCVCYEFNDTHDGRHKAADHDAREY